MSQYDIVIRNGQVADGTGRKLFAADVALKGDRITAVEAPGSLRGDNEIELSEDEKWRLIDPAACGNPAATTATYCNYLRALSPAL